VKYLLDTPEAVWGYLDGQQPLAAARRHLRAECVHGCLQAAAPPALKRRFPLLKAQFPAIHAQRGDIATRVRESLHAPAALPPAEVRVGWWVVGSCLLARASQPLRAATAQAHPRAHTLDPSSGGACARDAVSPRRLLQ